MKKNLFIVLTLFIFSVPSALALLHSGFYQVHDNAQVPRVYEMAKSLHNGMFPVRWVSDLGYGYGYPIFNFYSPFPYYIGAVFVLIGFSSLIATKVMFILPILLSAVTMFYFIREWTSDFPALCAALIYVYFSYHAVNAYIRGDIGELYSYALFPLVGWSLYKIWEVATKKKYTIGWITVFAVSSTLVVISHNLSAYMMALFLVPACIVGFVATKQRKIFVLSIISAAVFSFLLSAFYMLPALMEMKYTNVSSQVGGGADYKDHFVCIQQLWNSPWGFGGSTKGCVDGFSFKLGKTNVIAIILLFIFVALNSSTLIKKEKKNILLFLLSVIGILLTLFFMTDMSKFVWQTLPQMDFLQYPWRFLNFAGFFISLTIGIGLFLFRKKYGAFLMIVVCTIVIILTLFSNVKLFTPQQFNSYPSSYYTNPSYIQWTVSKISDEYLPKDFKRPQSEHDIPKSKFAIVNGLGEIGSIVDKTQTLSAKTLFATNAIVNVNLAPFPAWNAYIDGKHVDYAVSTTGMRIIVPSGAHTILFSYSATPIESFGNTLSILGIICLIFAIIKNIREQYGSKKTS